MALHVCEICDTPYNYHAGSGQYMYACKCHDKSEPRKRNGSPTFYGILNNMADTHDSKSHDYASNNDPCGNYHFAGQLASLFKHSPEDMGFIGRIGEKLYRLSNLEKDGKVPSNESVEDTEVDLCVIMTLWMSDRRDRRMKGKVEPISK